MWFNCKTAKFVLTTSDLLQGYYLAAYLLWWSCVLMLKSRWSLLRTQGYVSIFQLLKKKKKKKEMLDLCWEQLFL